MVSVIELHCSKHKFDWIRFTYLGRGLEKFLRRNSYSSDERENTTPITTRSKNKTKSLESLADPASSRKKTSSSSKSSPGKETKQEASPQAAASQEEKKSAEKPKPSSSDTKVVVKQSGEKLDKKKSHFNYESVIEITLPSAPVPAQIQDAPREKSATEEKLEEPITPIIFTAQKPKIPPSANRVKMSPTSVHESFVSNKQNPMEWDSFIPVSKLCRLLFNRLPTKAAFCLFF